MKLLLALYFFILATIQLGLLFGINHYYRSHKSVKPSAYWMASLTTSIFALSTFGVGILLNKSGTENPEFNFTIANTLFYIAAILQGLFCYSLNSEITKKIKIAYISSFVAFFILFEVMRQYSTFEMRTIFMCIVTSFLYAWQIYELSRKRKHVPSRQLQYLQYASSGEMCFAICRLTILVSLSFTIRRLDELPQVLILFTIMQLVMNTLSYIAISSYWSEQIAKSNMRSILENEEIRSLLNEREKLIASLLVANKTAATGALSAAIAHELNQPLGASSLNIQFLQKKLAEGQLNPVLENEILDTLLADNQRAAGIIRSLRSIFSDEKLSTSTIDLAELIDAVLKIAKPEIAAKSIQIVLSVEPRLMIQANRGEIQQVLLNLINNAIHALVTSSEHVKKLTIQARHIQDGVSLSVSDNGAGIPEQAQKHLFELLSSTKSSGMGLGLWLCKHIVTRHGGSIVFEPNPGGGAKFSVQFPVSLNPT